MQPLHNQHHSAHNQQNYCGSIAFSISPRSHLFVFKGWCCFKVNLVKLIVMRVVATVCLALDLGFTDCGENLQSIKESIQENSVQWESHRLGWTQLTRVADLNKITTDSCHDWLCLQFSHDSEASVPDHWNATYSCADRAQLLQSGPRPCLADIAEWEANRTTPKVEASGRRPFLVDGLHPNPLCVLPKPSPCRLTAQSSEVRGSLSLRYWC